MFEFGLGIPLTGVWGDFRSSVCCQSIEEVKSIDEG